MVSHILFDFFIVWSLGETKTKRNKKVSFFSVCGPEENILYNRTSLIRTSKGESEVSVLERCPYKRDHYDDVTFITPLTVLRVQLIKPGSHSPLNCI